MKVRNGFVSNSSSSSFVVEIRELKYQDTGKKRRHKLPKGQKIDGKNYITVPDMQQVATPLFITKKQMNALLKRGFKFGSHLYASRIEEGIEVKDVKPELATHMYYSVSCNEADEVEFLVKNGIHFEAATHYGHYSVFYRKGEDKVWIARNLGRYLETYKNSLPLNRMDGESLTVERDNILRSQTIESIVEEGWTK